jgi:multidrug resistance efflux pump
LTAAIVGGVFIWLQFQQPALPEGFASGNGRIEATEIDVATQWAGQIKEVLAREGDLVDADQVVARMDTANLEAQLRQAEAQVKQAQDARASVAALISQRESELAFARKDLGRILELTAKGFVSGQDADLKRTKQETTAAALAAAKAQATEAESAIAATVAAADRLKIDIEQGILKAPHTGRVQYRLTEPGEVLAAGGKVLTLLDLTDVDLTLFLPETAAGRVALGAEARIVLAKIWANGLVIVVAAVLSLYGVVQGWLGVPIAGSIPLFVAGTVIYLFSVTALGIFLATLTRSMPQFGLLAIPVFMVMNLLSGGTTPLDSMPELLQALMQLSPSTHFVSFAQAILYRDAGFAVVWPYFAAVAASGAVFFGIALLRFRRMVTLMQS